ncbi:MAG: hypothetical protein WAO22_04720 [bacterium]|jgi:hypothetical protein|nr:hypothetical protein [Bacillota bacterium]
MLELAFILWLTWLLLARGRRSLEELNTNRPLGADRIIERIRKRRRLW